MAVKIRLMRIGRHKKPFYRVVVADERMPRDGRHIDILGTYDTLTEPSTVKLDREKVKQWLTKGAQATTTVSSILKKEGILSELSNSQPEKTER